MHAVINLLSPMASAVLLTVTSLEAIFLVDVITASIAIVILTVFLNRESSIKPIREIAYKPRS
jgi:MFS transporter, DHA3 family, macrolide efflux protein